MLRGDGAASLARFLHNLQANNTHQTACALLGLAGLWDPYSDVHMGNCAELCAEQYQISRQEMDDHAIEAFQRAQAAAPFMQAELVPVQLPPRKTAPKGTLLDYDESLSKINEEKLRGLKPFFKQVRGAVTLLPQWAKLVPQCGSFRAR